MKRADIRPLTQVYATGTNQDRNMLTCMPVVALTATGHWRAQHAENGVITRLWAEEPVTHYSRGQVPALTLAYRVKDAAEERRLLELMVDYAASTLTFVAEGVQPVLPEGLRLRRVNTRNVIMKWTDYTAETARVRADRASRQQERDARATAIQEAYGRVQVWLGVDTPRSVWAGGMGEGPDRMNWVDFERLLKLYSDAVADGIQSV